MQLFLEITAGELRGTRALLREGFSIGRKKGTLNIRDSKLSKLHAIVEERKDQFLWLVDTDSANGIKVGEDRVRELKLEHGIAFSLGRTTFKVIDPTIKEGETTAEFLLADATVTRDWWHWVQELAERGRKAANNTDRKVEVFDPLVKLKFVRGPQTGTEWTLGYGPRMIGSSSIDLPLDDLTLPPNCFQLLPDEHGVAFKNESEKEVKLNGKWVATGRIRNGDMIEIRGTLIQVII